LGYIYFPLRGSIPQLPELQTQHAQACRTGLFFAVARGL
jgi:hypothetical protein